MKTKAIITSVVLTVSAASSAVAAPEQHPKQALRALSLIDQFVTHDQLVEAGIDPAGQSLVEIARDRSLPAYTRARAASMLGTFDSPVAREGLRAIIDDQSIRIDAVRVQAVRAYGHLLGAQAVPKLQQVLSAEKPKLRAAAVRTLASLKVYEPIEARRALETERGVKAQIDQALRSR